MKISDFNPIKAFINMMARLFEPIAHLFIWSSGANLEVLERVPTENNKYYGIGGTIVFTALMATFAGGYAFYTAFKNETLAVFFGIFWGALIYNLDRYIVSTFGVGDGKRTISRQELVEGLPRILMAIILGLVISTPLELKIFEREIAVKIEELKFEKEREIQMSDSTFWSEKRSLEEELQQLSAQLSHDIEGENELINEREQRFDSEIERIREDKTRAETNVSSAKTTENRFWSAYQQAKRDTTKTDREIQSKKIQYQEKRTVRIDAERELGKYEAQLDSLIRVKNAQVGDYQARLQETQGNTQDRINQVNAELRRFNEQAEARRGIYEQTSQTYDGFAAHLEAMSMVADEHTSVRVAKNMITLLFVFIEIAPILFKMMTERGPYDDILDQLKYEAKLAQDLKRSELNKDANVELELSTQKAKQKVEVELASNKKLLQYIADAQLELTYKAIDAWKEREAAKVRFDDGGDKNNKS